VRTVDIVPTMADILGIRVNWRHDGRSAFSPTTRRRRVIRIPTRDFSRIIRIGVGQLERRRQANLRRRIRAYGTGAQSKLVFGDPFAGVYRAVPDRGLLGRPVAGLKLARASRTRAAVAGAALTRSVDLGSGLLPTHIAGRVTGGRRGATRVVAVAVNGVVQSVGHTFYLAGSRSETFTVMVPEQTLRQGRNAVRVFEVSGRGRRLRLRPLGSN